MWGGVEKVIEVNMIKIHIMYAWNIIMKFIITYNEYVNKVKKNIT